MEDSSLKVELAEQEMRRAVHSMREEQRVSGAKAGVRQRSLADMQELIHGLREEQQQAKSALHACQASLCLARGTAMLHKAVGWERHCACRAMRRWLRAASAMGASTLVTQLARMEAVADVERRDREQVSASSACRIADWLLVGY